MCFKVCTASQAAQHLEKRLSWLFTLQGTTSANFLAYISAWLCSVSYMTDMLDTDAMQNSAIAAQRHHVTQALSNIYKHILERHGFIL